MDNFNIERFVKAQKLIYEIALNELKNGKKYNHWIWFIFPKLRFPNDSTMSHLYGITCIAEAIAYLNHPILSERLIECCNTLLIHKEKTAKDILDKDVDVDKLHSSMTLFAYVSDADSVFYKVLDRYYNGCKHRQTLELIKQSLPI